MSAVLDLANFRGHKVRIARDVEVRKLPQTVVPLNDVADALQYDRESMRQMVTRKRMISRHSTTCIIQAVDGKMRNTLCLTYEGVIGVVINLEPERITDHQRRKWVEDFQDWAVNTLAKVMRGEVPTRPPEPQQGSELVSMLKAELAGMRGEVANLQQQLPGMVAEIAARVAVAVVQAGSRKGSQQITFDFDGTGQQEQASSVNNVTLSTDRSNTRNSGNTRNRKLPEKKQPKGRLAPDSSYYLAFMDKLRSLKLGETFTRKDVEVQLNWHRVYVCRYMTAVERNGDIEVISVDARGVRTYRNPWANSHTH